MQAAVDRREAPRLGGQRAGGYEKARGFPRAGMLMGLGLLDKGEGVAGDGEFFVGGDDGNLDG